MISFSVHGPEYGLTPDVICREATGCGKGGLSLLERFAVRNSLLSIMIVLIQQFYWESSIAEKFNEEQQKLSLGKKESINTGQNSAALPV